MHTQYAWCILMIDRGSNPTPPRAKRGKNGITLFLSSALAIDSLLHFFNDYQSFCIMPNRNLNAARAAKKDEFYTQLSDIERELQHYLKHFCGKTVLCNCDDPYESNFFKYFALRFNQLGLKKLICTCYNGSPVQGNELMLQFDDADSEPKKIAYKVEITEVKDENGDGAVDLADVCYLLQNDKNVLSTLQTGDFRSSECIELLKEADIVVTNPPFSLFREYVAQLIEYDKKFIIIGHQNAITYKGIFPLIKDNKMWFGYGFKGLASHFRSPYKDIATASNHKENMIRVSGVVWFTNLDHNKRHEEMDLICRYSPDLYPKYDNYDAIEVSTTANIPMDYEGVMGVPITFLDKYCPVQFEILGCNRGIEQDPNGIYGRSAYLNGKEVFKRIFIKLKHPKTL